jgi:hypothetical protein
MPNAPAVYAPALYLLPLNLFALYAPAVYLPCGLEQHVFLRVSFRSEESPPRPNLQCRSKGISTPKLTRQSAYPLCAIAPNVVRHALWAWVVLESARLQPCRGFESAGAPPSTRRFCAAKVGKAGHTIQESPLVILLNPFFLRYIFACLAALQTVVAAVIHQPHIVFAIAQIAVPLALASFFHLLANATLESLGHWRTLPRIQSARNCHAPAAGSVALPVQRPRPAAVSVAALPASAPAAGSAALPDAPAPAALPARFAACYF